MSLLPNASNHASFQGLSLSEPYPGSSTDDHWRFYVDVLGNIPFQNEPEVSSWTEFRLETFQNQDIDESWSFCHKVWLSENLQVEDPSDVPYGCRELLSEGCYEAMVSYARDGEQCNTNADIPEECRDEFGPTTRVLTIADQMNSVDNGTLEDGNRATLTRSEELGNYGHARDDFETYDQLIRQIYIVVHGLAETQEGEDVTRNETLPGTLSCLAVNVLPSEENRTFDEGSAGPRAGVSLAAGIVALLAMASLL